MTDETDEPVTESSEMSDLINRGILEYFINKFTLIHAQMLMHHGGRQSFLRYQDSG